MAYPLFTAESLLASEPHAFVGGAWVLGDGGTEVINPATGDVLATVPHATTDDLERAIAQAVEAQRPWARKSYPERAAVLEAIVRAVTEHEEELAQIVVAEQGKTITEARGEIGGVRAFFDFAISQKYRAVGEMVAPASSDRHLMVREEPIGVIAAIIPWNFPAAIFARKVAPALMAGNAIVIKPSSETPLSSLALARVCQLAGLPDGLLSVLPGPGRVIGDALVTHPGVGMVTVTGSTRAGQQILEAAARKVIPVSLELGGKAPVVVFADADLDLAVDGAYEARFMNCGQVCTCNERTYVHRDVFDEFVSRFVTKVRGMVIGDPLDEATQMGPKVSASELEKITAFVSDAVAAGAKIEIGGGTPEGMEDAAGYWFAPTVLTNVTNDMDVVQKEVFGPVLPIIAFDTYDEVIKWANSTDYGLTAYVYTSNLHTAMTATDDLQFGEVYINQTGPEQVQGFHTGWKMSGLGGDDGTHGFERYLRRKTVYLDYAATSPLTELRS